MAYGVWQRRRFVLAASSVRLVVAASDAAAASRASAKAKLPDGVRSQAIEHEACNESGHKVETVDVNNDGKPDIRRVYDGAQRGLSHQRSESRRQAGHVRVLRQDRAAPSPRGRLRRQRHRQRDRDLRGRQARSRRARHDEPGPHRHVGLRSTRRRASAPSASATRRATAASTSGGRTTASKVTIAMDKNGDGQPDPDVDRHPRWRPVSGVLRTPAAGRRGRAPPRPPPPTRRPSRLSATDASRRRRDAGDRRPAQARRSQAMRRDRSRARRRWSRSVVVASALGARHACGGGRARARVKTRDRPGRLEGSVASGRPTTIDVRLAKQAGARGLARRSGPGALKPNVRRVYKIFGEGENRHKTLACREIDTNLDGIKDVVRTFNQKGEALHEEADRDYDGKVDVWLNFVDGRLAARRRRHEQRRQARRLEVLRQRPAPAHPARSQRRRQARRLGDLRARVASSASAWTRPTTATSTAGTATSSSSTRPTGGATQGARAAKDDRTRREGRPSLRRPRLRPARAAPTRRTARRDARPRRRHGRPQAHGPRSEGTLRLGAEEVALQPHDDGTHPEDPRARRHRLASRREKLITRAASA